FSTLLSVFLTATELLTAILTVWHAIRTSKLKSFRSKNLTGLILRQGALYFCFASATPSRTQASQINFGPVANLNFGVDELVHEFGDAARRGRMRAAAQAHAHAQGQQIEMDLAANSDDEADAETHTAPKFRAPGPRRVEFR
ncbi:hypothetical protein DXG03_005089, partial [Asterophora parasitica]